MSSWYDGILESGGELISNTVDVVGSFGQDLLNQKLTNEASGAASANPDEQRKNEVTYQQPNGEPIPQSPKANNIPIYIAIGVGFVVLGGAMVIALKGGK